MVDSALPTLNGNNGERFRFYSVTDDGMTAQVMPWSEVSEETSFHYFSLGREEQLPLIEILVDAETRAVRQADEKPRLMTRNEIEALLQYVPLLGALQDRMAGDSDGLICLAAVYDQAIYQLRHSSYIAIDVKKNYQKSRKISMQLNNGCKRRVVTGYNLPAPEQRPWFLRENGYSLDDLDGPSKSELDSIEHSE